MPLKEPVLDDRTFEQLMAELRLRIPRYTKEWTNFNDSDPGMTLLQLFAWLTELMLFRMNQVPLKNYVKFLKLLGLELTPARPASAHVTLVTKADSTASSLPKLTQFTAQPDDGGEPLVFETERGLDLIRFPLDTVGIFDGAAFTPATDANATPGTTFQPFGWAPEPGNALYLGFAPPDPPPTTATRFPQTMTFRVSMPAEATAGAPQKCTGVSSPPIPPVTLIWEYRPKPGEPWERLNVFEDETAAFTREGYIRVAGPESILPIVEARLNPAARFWIRVRLDGRYPAGRVPTIDFLRSNTVEVRNLQTVREEILGESTGEPNLPFTLQRKPVQGASVRIRTEIGETIEHWTPTADLLAPRPDARHFVVNPTSGVIQFGDGTTGRIPDAGALVIVTEYRSGGGKRGNVDSGAIAGPPPSGVEAVKNERAAVGGSDEETLDQLQQRAPAVLRRRNRAVTPDDFEVLVKEMGGIAQAKALPLFHPDHPGVSVAGAITVVIVPDNEDRPPKPSSDLIRATCDLLDEKRLLTTEVFVKGPAYQEIRVEARVTAKPYASFDAVTLEVIKKLDALLNPRTRVFGDELFPTRLYSTILEVPDVVGVLALNVYVDGRRHQGLEPITVPVDGLVFGRDHIITVSPAVDR